MNPALEAYLEAPAEIRAAFDREVVAAIARQRDDELWLSALLEGQVSPARIREVARAEIPRFDWRWQRRGIVPERKHRDYDRAFLAELDCRELWPRLTGEEVPRFGAVHCPLPDHIDAHPSCHVYSETGRGWFCFGCQRGGSILDLAAAVYGIEPRGAGYFELCRRLEAALNG